MINSHKLLRRIVSSNLALITTATSISLMPGMATAQGALEEVVVTARRREESLQETPIAVTALSARDIEELGIRNLSDLTKVVPNVDIPEGSGTGGAGSVFIRGMGALNSGVNFDSGVGIYVDGVYVARTDGALLDNIDLQSIQVLRGPQGTLFGKNTTGGAILYTTNKPVEEFEGHAEVRVGNYDRLDGKLTVNVPLIDDILFSRFSGFATTRDGFVKNELDGKEFNDIDRKGAQAQLRWVATDSLLLDLNYNYSKADQGANGQDCEVVKGIQGAGWQGEAQDGAVFIPSTGKSLAEWCQENNDLGKDDIQSDLLPSKYKSEVNSLALTLEWELGDSVDFKSVSAWRNTEGGETNNLDAIGIASLHRTNYGWNDAKPRNTDQYSQEFTFSGTGFDDKLDYVFGVFGFHEETDKGTAVFPSGPFFNALNIPDLAFYTNSTLTLLTKNTSASAFSQVDWNFNEYWRLTAGLRYTWEERKLDRKFRVPDINTLATTGDAQAFPLERFYTFPSGPDTFNPDHLFVIADDPDNPGQPDPLANQSMKIDDSQVTPMASIQRNFDGIGFMDSGTAYFTIANGFLSGGISDATDVTTREIYEYDPEKVWNYELGFKMEGWDNRLRLNTAIFYSDYTDRQLTTLRVNPDTGRIAGALINAKSSTISGIEIESVVLPLPNLQLTLNVTFNDGDIDKFDDERIVTEGSFPDSDCQTAYVPIAVDNCQVDRSDENLPRLPKQIYFAAVQYDWETEYGTITPLIQYSLRKDMEGCFDRASCLSGLYKVDHKDLGARLTWLSPDTQWRVTAYGSNLTDERYITGGTPLVDLGETAGTLYSLPRTYGVEAAFTW